MTVVAVVPSSRASMLLIACLSIIYLSLTNAYIYNRLNPRPFQKWSPRMISTDVEDKIQRESKISTIDEQKSKNRVISSVVPTINLENNISDALRKFVAAMNGALMGSQDALQMMLSADCSWSNPVVSSKEQLADSLKQFSNFFLDPSLVVFGSKLVAPNQLELEYQLSFWWPLPWRPRIIIPATALVTFSEKIGGSQRGDSDISSSSSSRSSNSLKVKSVRESWAVSPMQILTSQLWPRGWDVWNLFRTPASEYPPAAVLTRANNVQLESLPPSVKAVARWKGAAKFQGPPLQVVPGFSLFGKLKLSRPNREMFYTSLPVEVQSGKFTAADTGEEMKESTWSFHVPTMLQPQLLEADDFGKWQPLNVLSHLPKELRPSSGDSDDGEDSDDVADVDLSLVDFEIGYEAKTFMERTSGGAVRGNITVPVEDMIEFEQKQLVDFQYSYTPTRMVASTTIKGDPTASKIAAAVKEVKAAIAQNALRVDGKAVRIRPAALKADGDMPSPAESAPAEQNKVVPAFGLQLYGVKACFNSKGEPAMAAYETQYNRQLTKVFIEVEFSP